jgi:hypothetical protein
LTVTGVIDWSDAAIVDPAYDFGLLYRDLGPAAVRLALHSYRTNTDEVEAIGARAAFYARCSVLEDIVYGIETGHDKYLDKSLAALNWLYPASSHEPVPPELVPAPPHDLPQLLPLVICQPPCPNRLCHPRPRPQQ